MERNSYFDSIEERLSLLARRIELRGKLVLYNFNKQSEYLYLHLLNRIYGWNLISLDSDTTISPGIDLLDEENKICVQVSATATKNKIEAALAKTNPQYKGYSFKFISISKSAKNLRNKSYCNPNKLVFNPEKDIIDIGSILNYILGLTPDKQKGIDDFLKKEIKLEDSHHKVESNLASVIKVLSLEDWDKREKKYKVTPYDLDRKIEHNLLVRARKIIRDFGIHHNRLDKIYATFDTEGKNKSLSVLTGISNVFLRIDSHKTPDEQFICTVDNVLTIVRESKNYTPLPEEELLLCVQILVVDAFIRCTIFEEPPKEDISASTL